MKKIIINISREFGCNAREIGRQLASKLAVEFHDKDLIDLTAERVGINKDLFEESDAIVDKTQKGLFKSFGYGSSTNFYDEKAILAQAEVIKELANRGESCIFFGRCSDYILREYPNCLNIFLYAPLAARIKHIARDYDLDEKSAEKLIRRVDKQRHNYYKYVTGKNRGDREYKQVMLDVSEFGIEETVNILYHIVLEHTEQRKGI